MSGGLVGQRTDSLSPVTFTCGSSATVVAGGVGGIYLISPSGTASFTLSAIESGGSSIGLIIGIIVGVLVVIGIVVGVVIYQKKKKSSDLQINLRA